MSADDATSEQQLFAAAIGCPLGEQRRFELTTGGHVTGKVTAVAADRRTPLAVHVEAWPHGTIVLSWAHVVSTTPIPKHPALDDDEP